MKNGSYNLQKYKEAEMNEKVHMGQMWSGHHLMSDEDSNTQAYFFLRVANPISTNSSMDQVFDFPILIFLLMNSKSILQMLPLNMQRNIFKFKKQRKMKCR